jgi:hypothetical protein
MERNNMNDANTLQPVTIRLAPGVLSVARAEGEFRKGGTSAVLRDWLKRGMGNKRIFCGKDVLRRNTTQKH